MKFPACIMSPSVIAYYQLGIMLCWLCRIIKLILCKGPLLCCCVNIVPKQANAHFVRTHLTPVEKKQLLALPVAALTHLLDLFFALKRHLAAQLKLNFSRWPAFYNVQMQPLQVVDFKQNQTHLLALFFTLKRYLAAQLSNSKAKALFSVFVKFASFDNIC